MAKELPYFKFEPNAWDNGNIQILSREDKGLFMDLCSMYWSRLGDVPFKLAVQKLCGGNATALDSLCEENIIAVVDDSICIDFLNEQLAEFESISEKNSENARIGWEKRRNTKGLSDRNATAFDSQSESDAIREEKRREEDKKGFNEFWNVYNHKKNKKGTERKWAKLKSEDIEMLLIYVPEYVKRTNTNGTYPSRQHPLTFLNAETWNDDLPENGVPDHIPIDYGI